MYVCHSSKHLLTYLLSYLLTTALLGREQCTKQPA